jgi:hypothetical protein
VRADVVEYLQGVVKIVFVRVSIARFNPMQFYQFGEKQPEQTGFKKQVDSDRWFFAQHNFVEFIHDAFHGYNGKPAVVAYDGFKRIVFDRKPELRSKTDGTHHAQGIIAIGDIGIEGSTDYFFPEVIYTVERVNQLTVIMRVQANGHGVDGEIAPVLVIA